MNAPLPTDEHFELVVHRNDSGFTVRIGDVVHSSIYLGDAAEEAICEAYQRRTGTYVDPEHIND